MRDGDFSVENLERNFNTLMGDAQVVDKVIVPRDIPESLAKERRVVTLTLENTCRSIKTVRCIGV
jgi:hypothetical protein